ncbi:MAG: hypothetical protein MK289_14740 [Trichodesmium sp. ALOHA_ZT_67]|nr:hypothetical protein [Trichodesmium erythraeum GBRTRLIN201]MCH2049696.1 hypothetical protein [Trichodesmium sp. ALOHA_ZT_67]
MLGVNVRTLVRWEKSGEINPIKTPSEQSRHDIKPNSRISINRHLNVSINLRNGVRKNP